MKDRLFILIIFIAAALGLPRFFTAPESEIPQSFCVYLTEEERIAELSAEEYLIGCLAAQIPLDYAQEALNAQAAAAMTYAVRLKEDFKNNPADIPEGADLSDSGKVCQPYFTPEKCAETYGESYEKYLPALKIAAEYGAKHVMTFENRPIYAVYHSVSTGRTNSAVGIWGREFDYIRPADSHWDKEYINYECRNEMTVEQARICLVNHKADIVTPADYSKWFSEVNANEDGYVISVKIGENLFTGGDIWRIFGLRSTAFKVEYTDGIFTFITKGFGHGAGLSQYGANEMAKSGSTAEEILRHYYGGEIDF